MRDIKFRGYDKDTKRWYYGSYVRLERYSGYAMSQTPEEDNKKHQEEAYDDYILFTEMNDWGLETRKLRATVDPKSVGQFIGLRDRLGKEIYEGDIIAWCRDEVEDKDGNSKPEKIYYAISYKTEKFTSGFYGRDFVGLTNSWCEKSVEVAGNIYENPDLVG